jgi:hypothetical protein
MAKSFLVGAVVFTMFSLPVFPAAIVVSATGLTAASITLHVISSVSTSAEDWWQVRMGHLERFAAINWDGVPHIFASPNSLPANFFNVNSPRRVIFSTPRQRFQGERKCRSGGAD